MTDGAGDATFCLPDLGEGLSEAEIVQWHVAPGDRVVADQPLVTVETDKAVVDIPSPRSGVVDTCLGEPGDVIEVGQPLLQFAVEARRPDAGAVVGALPSAASATPSRIAVPAAESPAESGVRASPRARQRARELSVSLEAVAGTGPEGVIQVSDVESAAAGAGGGERLGGVRRAMARRMTDAHARVVRATVTGEADVSRWSGIGSPMPRLLRALGAAVAAVPRLNAWFDDRAETLALQSRVNVGIAMETADGLFVPVLEDVAGRTLESLTSELTRLQDAVARRLIRPDQLKGQTISLSNFGAVAGLHAEMVVVPPQVAIVGSGRVFERVVLADGKPTAAQILPLSISFDHRVVTGVEASTFLMALTTDLENDQ
jgi:pyruvate dehydrogenase E2 component (dihydrolipoamide acetyltransferase)